jgi:hypothetical protein
MADLLDHRSRVAIAKPEVFVKCIVIDCGGNIIGGKCEVCGQKFIDLNSLERKK